MALLMQTYLHMTCIRFQDLCISIYELSRRHISGGCNQKVNFNLKDTLDAMSTISSSISQTAASLLAFSPSAYVKSWLLYLGVQTHVRGTIDPELKPLHNVCEYLNALHIYAEEARAGKTRAVEAYHFCSHVNKSKYVRLRSHLRFSCLVVLVRFSSVLNLRFQQSNSTSNRRRIHDPPRKI